MRVILSRKGFDSGAGGIASPILPNGDLLSLPIPDDTDHIKYSDVKYEEHTSYFDLLSQLTSKDLICGKQKIPLNVDTMCHLDPDLNSHVIERKKGWKPLFGQISAAQSHLENNGVEVGDLFIFFGWFRETIQKEKQLMFNPKDKNGKHIIFGYFQIGDIINTSKHNNLPEWIQDHPHYKHERRRVDKKNTIYVASETLSWNNQLPGAGTFKLDQSLILTKKDSSRSHWELPDFFKNVKMTYHTEASWETNYFKCADRGQEFVIQNHPEVINWAKRLIELNSI